MLIWKEILEKHLDEPVIGNFMRTIMRGYDKAMRKQKMASQKKNKHRRTKGCSVHKAGRKEKNSLGKK